MTLTVITSPRLTEAGARHAFFTRQGGVSRGLYAGLNVGEGSDDLADHVRENRRLAAEFFGLAEDRLATNYQVHSADAVAVSDLAQLAAPRARADALASNLSGLALGALSADCAPILLFDPQANAAAAVHAGWRGALSGVAEQAVALMTERFGAAPARIVAAVGPCIGPASYEVGLEFRDRFVAAEAANERFFAPAEGAEKRLFDLPSFVLSRLRAAGVEACEWTGHDTCADEARFFSNRRAVKRGEADYGRLLSAIALD
ncbi:peptidoglycan editing factor PgeF [Phenylobacterium immobile]|uniref:peptidoglycan editing factor PgeF n=1 Tax=Phenylobacterium immobile TaxID=21 RepID=UPI000AE6D445|nr:peptidoglycan editing factor PgeF [Phenylobacterium immobile]